MNKKTIISMDLCLLVLIAPLCMVGAVPMNSNDKLGSPETITSVEKPGALVTPNSMDWWPMFHHDLHHSGYSPSPAPGTNTTGWTYPTGSCIRSSPVVSDGKVYIGSNDNNLYCLHAITGIKLWNYTTGWIVGSTPAVADGKVYFGSWDNYVYCFNARNGSFIWKSRTNNPIDSSASVAYGRVYIGSWDRHLYCYDADNGTRLWRVDTGGNIGKSSPAVVDGRVYIGASVGQYNGKVLCVDAFTGNEIWNYASLYDFDGSSPAIADEKVYISSWLGRKVYCFNALNGTFLWAYPTGDYTDSSPAIAYGNVYVASTDGKVHCINASTGQFRWSTPLSPDNPNIRSSPAVADGKVYIGWPKNFDGSGGGFYCLNAYNGTVLWYSPQVSYVFSSSPAVAYRSVYIGAYGGKVYCFGNLSLGDVNSDGVVNYSDINPFVYVLSHTEMVCHAQYPNWCYWAADCNEDGVVNFSDINPFVQLLIHGE